jgi:ribosomal protein S10
MKIQTYNMGPYTGHTLTLQYSSYAEKDIQASVGLTIKFLNALQRWHHYRNVRYSKTNMLVFWRFAEALSDVTMGYSNPKPLQRHTVIRSAFVYKKTREQFGLRMRTYRFYFRHTKFQQKIFLTWISQLKLPAELKVRFN